MKKRIILPILAVAMLALAGCGKKNTTVNMNELSSDEKYHYSNEALGFGLSLPKEFIYYQTQRKDLASSTNLEIYVPTSDQDYPVVVPGYAKAAMVMQMDKAIWNIIGDKTGYVKVGERDHYVYALLFWDKIPKDWQGKWSDAMQKGIVDSFKLK